MPEENLKILRRAIARWSSADLEGFIALLHPDVEWRTSGLYPGLDPVYHGHEGFRKFWRDFHEPWDSIEMVLEQAVAVGDRLAFRFQFKATGRDGLAVGRRQAGVATFDDHLIVRMENHAAWDRALAAIGLSEEELPGDSSAAAKTRAGD